MTKYRIRLPGGRVIGPFLKEQLFELKSKGHIQGKEDAQIFPTGEWKPIHKFDFWAEVSLSPSHEEAPRKEETFVFDLSKLKAKQVEEEIQHLIEDEAVPNKVELTATTLTPVEELEPTVLDHVDAGIQELELDVHESDAAPTVTDVGTPKAPEVEDREDKTAINPQAQKELKILQAKLKQEQLNAEAEAKRKEEAELRRKESEALALKLAEEEKDESTRMVSLDALKSDLIVAAKEEEEKIAKVELEYKKKKKKEEDERRQAEDGDDEEEEEEEETGRKKISKILLVLAILGLGYAFFFPEPDNQKPPFKHINPIIEFPISAEVADVKASKVQYSNGLELFDKGGYTNLIKASQLFKSAYENDVTNIKALSLMTRIYAELLPSSKEFNLDAYTIFNLIQSKNAHIFKEPDGIIAISMFYRYIDKKAAAAEFMAKYLRLYPKNISSDLFATYVLTLIDVGNFDEIKNFFPPLLKMPKKNRYAYEAIIKYYMMNNEFDKANEYLDTALKENPERVQFMLLKADLLLTESNLNSKKKFKEMHDYLQKAENLNFEYNDQYLAKFLELTGFMAAFKKDVKLTTAMFRKSLKLNESKELRSKLSKLDPEKAANAETRALIEESRAIQSLALAQEFYKPGTYQLAWSKASRVAGDYPDFLPAQLFLAEVQMKLGFIEPALTALKKLQRKHSDNKTINIALTEAFINTYKFHDAKNMIALLATGPAKGTWEFASLNGRLNTKMGDLVQAISWYKAAIQMNPINDKDIFRIAEIVLRRNQFEPAKVYLNKAMELDPLNPDYRIAYAKIVYETQDVRSAIGYLLETLKEFPDNPRILGEMAILSFKAGLMKDFEAYKQKLESFKNKDKSLQEFLIRSALLEERYAEIPGLVEELLKVEPGDLESMMTAGRVLFESGKLTEAAKWFKRVRDKLETYPKVQYYIARISLLAEEYEKNPDGSNSLDANGKPILAAKALIMKDIKENGENDVSLSLLAQILANEGDLIGAENTYKKAQKINPKSYEALVGLADISVKRSNFDIALDLYKKALAVKSDEAVLHRKMGEVYQLLGQGALASEEYQLYLEMNPDAPDKANIQAHINLLK